MGSARGLTLEIYDENNVTFFASRVGGQSILQFELKKARSGKVNSKDVLKTSSFPGEPALSSQLRFQKLISVEPF